MALTKIPASLIDTSSGINGLIYPSSDGTNNQVLTTDGSGTLSFSTVSVTGTTINNNADNRIITGSGTANTLEGESGLTYNGSTLAVTGTLNIDSNGGVDNYYLRFKESGADRFTMYENSNNVYLNGGPGNTIFRPRQNGGTGNFAVIGSNVGIGTTSPATKLNVSDSSGTAYKALTVQSSNVNSDVGISLIGGGGSDFRLQQPYNSAGLFFYDVTNNAERMRIGSSGNVGIGTTSPNQDGFSAASRVLTVKAPSSGGTGALELIGLANSSGDLMSAINFMSYAVTSPAARITAIRHTSDTAASIAFDTSGAERVRIDSNGIEGSFFRANNWAGSSINTIGGPAMEIGYAGSSGYLHGYNRNSSSYIPVSYDGTEHRWYLSGGTGGSAVLNSNGQFLVNFSNPASTSNFLLGVDGSIGLGGDDFIASGAGYGPSNSSAGAGTIKLYDTGTGNMQFNQTYSHARYYFYHGGNEVFRIEDGGFSGIYGYSYYYTTTHGSVGIGALNSGYHHTMAASGPSTFYWNNRCEASGGFHTYSDERLKENVTTISGALDKVALMNGVTFNWIDAENRGSGDTGKQFGVIAQNMLTIDPELPSLNPDPLATQEDIDNEELETDYYTMDYSRITPFLIEAIKELKTKLEAAEARIETLEG